MTALRTILPPPPLLHPFCKPTGYHPTDRVTEPSAPGGENLRTRRVSTGERGRRGACVRGRNRSTHTCASPSPFAGGEDRKSTRLNSSHVAISYAVFCLKKKKQL